jgi:solute carrier family 10 (sodium/bile acid cotransporter), member 7
VAHPPFFLLHTFYFFITNIPAYIVYTVFCKEFQIQDQQIQTSDIFIMIAFQFILMVSFMIFVWYGLLRNVAAPQRVMGLFGCTQKTIAIGIPLINAVYENSNDVALYTLPLLVWHPLQLVLGTLIAPTLAAYVVKQQEQAQAAAAVAAATAHGNDEEKANNLDDGPSPPPFIGSSGKEEGVSTATTTTTAKVDT